MQESDSVVHEENITEVEKEKILIPSTPSPQSSDSEKTKKEIKEKKKETNAEDAVEEKDENSVYVDKEEIEEEWEV